MNRTRDRQSGQLKRKVEWPTVGLVAFCYLLWAGAAFFLYSAAPAAGLAVMAVAAALHSSLQHEILHGHPTRNGRINEALIFLPIGLWFPFRRFRATHLRHHRDERLTDPYDDPESFYRAAYRFEGLPGLVKQLLRVNNMLAGRLILGPGLMVGGFVLRDLAKIREGNREVVKSWALHFAGMIPVFAILESAGVPIWLYALTSAYGGLSLIAVRTFAEHQWTERPDGRTIIVERSILSMLFLNNNLHLVHHEYPTIAWYDLPALYRARRGEWIEKNGGYVFRNYGDIFRAFALRAKEPVAHPVLRRVPEPARHFHPEAAGEVPNGVPAFVPAEPAKE